MGPTIDAKIPRNLCAEFHKKIIKTVASFQVASAERAPPHATPLVCYLYKYSNSHCNRVCTVRQPTEVLSGANSPFCGSTHIDTRATSARKTGAPNPRVLIQTYRKRYNSTQLRRYGYNQLLGDPKTNPQYRYLVNARHSH